MSVIGRVGLVPNPYKGTLKYYVDWATRGSRSAHLACTFPIEVGKRKMQPNSPAFEVIEGWFALAMPKDSVPTNDLEGRGGGRRGRAGGGRRGAGGGAHRSQ